MRLKLSGTECRMMNFKTHINDRCRNQPDRYGWVDYDERSFHCTIVEFIWTIERLSTISLGFRQIQIQKE